jgi:hypothetical protein
MKKLRSFHIFYYFLEIIKVNTNFQNNRYKTDHRLHVRLRYILLHEI